MAEVSERLGVSTLSLYQWIKRYSPGAGGQASHLASKDEEIRKLKLGLRLVTEERDIFKKGRRVLCQGIRVKYAFLRDHRG